MLEFEEPFVMTTISENSSNGTTVLEVVAFPVSGETDGTEVVEYFIEATVPVPFAVDSETGVISVAGELDRETVDSYQFIVRGVLVNDVRAVPAQTAIFVTVSDVNDNRPLFEQDSYQANLRENEPSGTLQLTLRAIDVDQGQNANISYSLLQPSDIIAVESISGVLTNTRPVDYELTQQVVVIVLATDAGTPALSADINITITIVDENDNRPTIHLSSQQEFVQENVTIGTAVAQANATDLDLADSILFSLLMADATGGRVPSLDFTIDEFTGQITTSASLDYEMVLFYELVVMATDNGGLSSEAVLLVNITDVNDNSPTFAQNNFNLSVREDTAIGATLFVLDTTDNDSPSNSETVFTLITSDPFVSTLFNVSAAGELTLSSPLDYETQASYVLTVRASNTAPGAGSSTANITIMVIDVNEFAPVFTQNMYNATIEEEAQSGVFVVQASATDQDGTAAITYSINLQEFLIVANGSIFTTQPLDRENISVYEITVTASDNSIPGRNASSVVLVYLSDINDNPPALSSPTELTISETMSVGTEVLKLTAMDPDDGLNGEIGSFTLLTLSDSFNLTLSGSLVITMQLDAVIVPQHIILIQVNDLGAPPLSSTTSLTVNVEPSLAPMFTQARYTASIAENNEPNAFLLQVQATSRHQMVTIVGYSLSPDSIPLAGVFAVDTNTGNVTVLESLDREARDSYSLSIIVEALFNGTILTAAAPLNVTVVDVNDNPPLFDQQQNVVFVPETAGADSAIITLQASDNDTGGNAHIEYTIATGNEENLFRIEANGTIFATTYLLGRVGNYTLIVLATNPVEVGALNSTAEVLIAVQPVNTFTPQFSQPAYIVNISESSNVGALLGILVAMDADEGTAGDITYRIQSDGSSGRFTINSTSGELFLSDTVDYELQTTFNLNVTATDAGTPPFSSVVLVTIEVQDVNDQRPIFTSPLFVSEVDEGLPAGAVVTILTYNDEDSPPNAQVVFNVPSDVASLFAISINGTVQTLAPLDRENVPSYTFTVTAVNEGGGVTLTGTTTLQITVEDVNDNNPLLSQRMYARVLQAPVSANTSLLTVQASDADAPGPNSQLSFSLVNSSGVFAIGTTTGTISIISEIKNAGNFSFAIEVTDQGQPPLSSNATVMVTVLPADDLTAGRERDFVFTADRGIHLVGASAEVMVGVYNHQYGYAIGRNVFESRQVSVGLGPLSATQTVSPSQRPAVSVAAILVNALVWHDSPSVQLVVQVRDEAGSVHTEGTSVFGMATHPSLGPSQQSSCSTRSSDGTCMISVPIPLNWFSSSEVVNVQYGLSSTTMQTAGVVEIQPQILFTSSDNIYVYMEMPFQDLFRRDRFSVTVYGQAGSKAVGSFTISVMGSSDIVLTSLTVDGSVWQAETGVSGDGSRTIIAVRADQTIVPPSGRVVLFTINAQVSGSSTLDTLLTNAMMCTVTDLSDFDRMRVLPPPGETAQLSMTLSRNGITTSGAVYVAADRTVGLLPYTESSELINTALLNGEPVISPLTVLEVRLTGNLLSSTTPLVCETANPSVVSVSTDCASVMVTQDNTQASTSVEISITQGTLSASTPVRVWIPQTALRASLSDTILNRIPGLATNTEACSPVYQTAHLTVFADFTDSQEIIQNIDITDMISSLVTTSDSTILSANERRVSGISAGIAELQYQSPSQPSGREFTIEVNVTDAAVEVLGLDVQVLTLLTADGLNNIDRLSTTSLTLTTEQVFDFEGTQGVVISTAVFADGTRSLLNQSSVTYQSLDSDIISVSGSTVTALASGEGDLIRAIWTQPQDCGLEPIATGIGIVRVTIPQPVRIDVIAQTVLTRAGSIAESINVPTATSVSITAVYSDGRSQDLSNDNRTQYIVPSDLILVRSDDVILSVNSEATPGNYVIQISFAQFPSLGQSVTISVVELEDIVLSATPFPIYPGSSNTFITQLQIIAATGVRQKALVAANGILSNSETRSISFHPELTFEITEDQNLQSRIDRSASGNVLTVPSVSQLDSVISISAMLGRVDSSTPLQLTISSNEVDISVINIENFPSFTFNGIADSAQHQVVFTAIFQDGTQYVNLFRDNSLPNLVTFDAPSSAVDIDRLTGVSTLRRNLPTTATITVEAINNLIESSINFFTNLDPDIGDVDLGELTGPPLPPITMGQTFTVPVRVNSGSTILGSIELDIAFNPSTIRAVSAIAGPDWPAGGNFVPTLNDPLEIVSLGGTLVGGAPVSGLSHLADVTFEVVGTGTTDVSGTVVTLADVGTLGAPAENIGTVPRPFIAGNVQIQLNGGVGKRDISYQTRNVQTRRVKRQTACSDDSPRETGDLDGNCVFDVRDGAFLQQYILQSLTTGTPPALPANRAMFLDIDANGRVDVNDVVFMLRVNFRLLRFFLNPKFDAVEDSESCQLTFNVSLLQGGDSPASSSTTSLVIDIAHSDSDFQDEFDASNFTTGFLLPTPKGMGLHGGLVLAAYLGDGVYGFTMNTAISKTLIGLSLIQVIFDNNNDTSAARTAALFSQSGPRYGNLDVTLSLRQQSVPISTQLGYSPLYLFDSVQTTEVCLFEKQPLRFINSTYSASINESVLVGTEVLALSAISTRPDAAITYSINNNSFPFSINLVSGVVTLSQPLDFETQQMYQLTITATEVGGFYTATAELVILVINVNDLPPIINDTAPVQVVATQSNGDIARVIAVDPDGLDELQFELTTSLNQFKVNQSTGVVSIASSLMDLANTIVDLNISVSDSLFTNSTSVTVDVFLPTFTEQSVVVSIQENAIVGTAVVNISIENARDLEFVLVSADPSFTVSNDGVVTVDAGLDFEAQSTHIFNITATSTSPPVTLITTLNISLIDINDNPPTYSDAVINITINSSTLIGERIASVIATDADSGVNADISYTLQTPTSLFTLHRTTGDLFLAGTLLGVQSSLEIIVIATDGGAMPLNGSARIMIEIVSPSFVDFPIAPIFVASNGLAILSDTQMRNNNSFAQQFSKLHNSKSEELSATLSGMRITASVSSTLQNGVTATAALLQPSTVVYQESPTISVAFQVRDSDHLTTVVNTIASFDVVRDALRNSSDSCVPDDRGVCVAVFTVPQNWFTQATTVIIVEPQLNGQPVDLNVMFITLQPSPSNSLDFQNAIITTLPSRDIVSGQTFTMDISAYISNAVVGFAVSFQLHPSLEVMDVIINNTQWGVQTASGNNTLGIVAIVATPVEQFTARSPVYLFSVQLRVVTSNPATIPISGTIHSLSDAIEGSVILDSTNSSTAPLLLTGRDGGVSEIGTVNVVPDTLQALFPYTEQPEILNTAALDGIVLSIQVYLLGAYSSGEILPYTADITCSSNTSVVNIDSVCSSLLLNGEETGGADNVLVRFNVSDITASMPVRVYHPQRSVRLVASDTTLNRIQYTLADTCTSYQQASLSVFADFKAGERALTNVSLAHLLPPPYLEDDESTVLQLDGHMMYGRSPGSTRVCVGSTTVCIEITVSTEVVKLVNVISLLIVELSLTANSTVVPNSVETALFDIRSQLQFEQEIGTLLVAVQYTDGTYSPVDISDVTLNQPVDTSVYTIQTGQVTARGGSGLAELFYRWTPLAGTCGLTVSETISVTADLPQPVSVRTTTLTLTIATIESDASLAGLPTTLSITMELVYSDNRTLNITGDSRLSYMPSSNLIAISSIGEVTATGQGAGVGVAIVVVMFTNAQSNLTIELSVEVVAATGLEISVTPYPSYPGSENDQISTLSPLEDTGIWQRGVVALRLSLTNGQTLDVTSLPRAVITVVGITISNEFVLSVNGAGGVLIDAMFGSLVTDIPRQLTVSSTPITVTNISLEPLPNNVLVGTADISPIQVYSTITFSDGTMFINYPAPSLPSGLVVYSTDSNAIAVNQSGMITPLQNSMSLVALTATSKDGSVSSSIQFTVDLVPNIGDVDLVLSSFGPFTVDNLLSISIFINTGGRNLGVIELSLLYDSQVLSPVSAELGSDWTSGIFAVYLFDSAGIVRMGGVLTVEGAAAVDLHLLTVHFNVIGPSAFGESYLRGELVTLTEFGAQGITIGAPTPRPFVAGDTRFFVDSTRKRSAMQSSSTPRTRRAIDECLTFNCSCSRSTQGDIDGNCLFDLSDVSFALRYLSQSLIELNGDDSISSILDQNRDDAADTTDVYFLFRAALGLTHFLQDVQITPVQDALSACLFTVNVQLSSSGQTDVLIDLALDPQLTPINNIPSTGSILTTDKGSDLSGALYSTQLVNGSYILQLGAEFVSSMVGVSVVLVTYDSRRQTSADRTTQFFGPPPPTFGALNITLTQPPVRLSALNGYSSLLTVSNSLESSQCNNNPVLGLQLNATFLSPFQAVLDWTLLNRRTGLNFTDQLRIQVQECSISQAGVADNICPEYLISPVQANTQHTLPSTPFTEYAFRVLAPNDVQTNMLQVRSPEASPEGLSAPTYEHIAGGVVLRWSVPSQPNGIITHYTLTRNSRVVFNESSLIVTLHSAITVATNVSLTAYNSAGFTTSPPAVIPPTDIEGSTLSPGLPVAITDAIIVCVLLTVCVIVILLVLLAVGMKCNRRWGKDKPPPFISLDFDAEKIGVVSYNCWSYNYACAFSVFTICNTIMCKRNIQFIISMYRVIKLKLICRNV